MDQHTFQNVRVSAQVHAAQAASFVEMREGTFEPFATQAQQPLATSAVNASPVPIDGGARLGFTRPVASPAIRFRDVAADSHRFEILGQAGVGDAVFNALSAGRMRVPATDYQRIVTIIGEERAKLCISLPDHIRYPHKKLAG